MLLVKLVFKGKSSLGCLPMGHIEQIKGCFGEKWTGIDGIPLVFTKGTCPSLLCHRRSTLFISGKIECEVECRGLLQLGVFTGEQE